MNPGRFVLLIALAAGATAVAAQPQFYRWTDEQGRTHVTDTPPPPGTKDVRRVTPGAFPKPTDAQQPQVPLILQNAMKDYPVTLYSSPNCGDPCATARDLLNKRGVPFTEKQVWEEEGNEELKKLSGKSQVPALKVGNTVQSGFERSAYSALLDSAGYPREGVLPARAQAAPGRPEGYVPPGEREVPKAEPARPADTAPAAAGPYAPGAPPQRPQRSQKKQ